MAPCLKSVYNVSGKNVHVNIDGSSFDIDHDESVPIDKDFTTEGYTKIDRVNSEDIQGYRIRYSNYNLLLNDALGKQKDIGDFYLHTKWSDQDVRIQVFASEMHLSGNGNYLGIYAGDDILYFRSVVVRHKTGGGVTVKGGENTVAGAEDVKEKEDEVEVEEASASKEVPNA